MTDPDHRLVHVNLKEIIGDDPTPFEYLDTLDLFVTMGSPMALWSLRYPEAVLDDPIRVAKWFNFWNKDDIISYPLEEVMRNSVVQDYQTNGSFPLGSTPLGHFMYWNDNNVIHPIADALAELWVEHNTV